MSFQDLESGRSLGSRRDYANGKQDPTQAVASGIFQINTAVSIFQRLVNTLGTPKDTPELREKLWVFSDFLLNRIDRGSFGLNFGFFLSYESRVLNSELILSRAFLATSFVDNYCLIWKNDFRNSITALVPPSITLGL